VCEEDPYLLELIRYIHLNPVRAKLVEDLKALDKYLWAGHSVLLGNNKNPLVPEMNEKSLSNSAGQPGSAISSLAEKTADEVLCNFGRKLADARRHYRGFVEKGIVLGRQPEFQGGGLLRSMGGKIAAISEIRRGQKEKSDQRVLGSGDFVSTTLQQSERILEKKYLPKRPIEELIEIVGERLELSPELICSGSRKRLISDARALLAYLAVEETGHKATDVARILGIRRVSVHHAAKKGKKVLENLPSPL